eukprot:4352343-Karenia_brevis.AAC.1
MKNRPADPSEEAAGLAEEWSVLWGCQQPKPTLNWPPVAKLDVLEPAAIRRASLSFKKRTGLG